MLDQFKKDGYLVLDSVFSNEEIQNFRKITKDFFSIEGNGFNNCEGVTQPAFLDIPFFIEIKKVLLSNNKINSVLREVLDNNYRFCSHSDIAMNRQVGWHKDGLNGKYRTFESIDPWKNRDDYKIVKVLVYLQDHSDASIWDHAIEVKKGSHVINDLTSGESVKVYPKMGSVIIFDQRLTHQAQYKKSSDDRILITLGFGKNNYYTDDFEKGTIARQNEQNKLRRQI